MLLQECYNDSACARGLLCAITDRSSPVTQVLEDEQINLSRAAERLLSLREEARALAEKGPTAEDPAPEGEHGCSYISLNTYTYTHIYIDMS